MAVQRPAFSALLFPALLGCLLAITGPAGADEFRLPASTEVETFSRDAMPFYIAGVASLDRADYGNAYSSLAKAAQLQPDAVRLNQIVGALALKMGRSNPAGDARGFYETAIISFENVLRQKGLPEPTRREVTNRLRVVLDERDNLEQRDARRESIGTYYILDVNKSFSAANMEAARKASSSPTPAPAVGQMLPPGSTPLVGAFPGTGPLNPGAPTPAYPTGVPTPAPAGGPSGVPGPIPPAVPGVPEANPPTAPLPGAPPAPAGNVDTNGM